MSKPSDLDLTGIQICRWSNGGSDQCMGDWDAGYYRVSEAERDAFLALAAEGRIKPRASTPGVIQLPDRCEGLGRFDDLVIAFTTGSKGTQLTIDEARRRGIAVEVHGTERPSEQPQDQPEEGAP